MAGKGLMNRLTGKVEKDEDKEFKGSGIEGKKAPDSEDSGQAAAGGDSSPESPASEKPTGEESGKPDVKEMKERLKKLKAEHKKLLKEEDERGYIDGHMVSARRARESAIESLEGEIAAATER